MSADVTSLVVVDTNVLLAATDKSRRTHQAATQFLNTDPRRLALTPQIVREYLVVATRPVAANGLGLTVTDAVTNIEEFLADMEFLDETLATTRHLLDLVGRGLAEGKQIHDANLVATALAHRASALVTDNQAHFLRFAGLIRLEDCGGGCGGMIR